MPPIKKPKALPTLCRWHIYGCEYHYTTDKAHEDICLRRPIDAGADILWRELVTHVESDANPIIDIRASLGPWARELKHVRVHPGHSLLFGCFIVVVARSTKARNPRQRSTAFSEETIRARTIPTLDCPNGPSLTPQRRRHCESLKPQFT
jgi:hypothetical protein